MCVCECVCVCVCPYETHPLHLKRTPSSWNAPPPFETHPLHMKRTPSIWNAPLHMKHPPPPPPPVEMHPLHFIQHTPSSWNAPPTGEKHPLFKVTGKRFAHATGPLVNNVKLRTIWAAGVQVRFFHVKFSQWHIFCLHYLENWPGAKEISQ